MNGANVSATIAGTYSVRFSLLGLTISRTSANTASCAIAAIEKVRARVQVEWGEAESSKKRTCASREM
jgi:hypothetical protein